MLFGSPTILWVLAALSVPVIVHLFDFRRYKRVQFSDNYLLVQLLEKNRRQNRLRQIIIMILRMLFIASLVFAFAKPYFPSGNAISTTGDRLFVSVYIDNSLSMETSDGKTDLLEKARVKAREIAAAFPPASMFRLITNDFQGIYDRFAARGEFIDMLNSVGISPFSRPMSQVVSRMSDLADREAIDGNHFFYLLSDFQKVTADISDIRENSKRIYLMPLAAETPANIAVDSVWFSGPLQLENNILSVNARIRNHSSLLMEKIPVRLYVDGKQKGLSDVQLASGGSDNVSFSFTVNGKGSHEGYVEIDDSPVSFDDRMFFAFDIASSVSVYHISGNDATSTIPKLFGNDSLFSFISSPEGSVDMDRIGSSGLIILDELSQLSSGLATELSRAADNGAVVLVIPPANISDASYRSGFQTMGLPFYSGLDTANTRVSNIDALHPLFKGVFETPPANIQFPAVFSSYRLSKNSGRSIMGLLNGNSFLTDFVKGRGHVYLLATPLQPLYSSFASNALIVPTIVQMAFSGRVMPAVAYSMDYAFGIELTGTTARSEKPPVLKSFDGSIEMIPGYNSGNPPRIFLNGQVNQAGAYKVMSNKLTLMSFGLNYPRSESFPDCFGVEELNKMVLNRTNFMVNNLNNNTAVTLADLQSGTKLWKIFIIFALLFLAAELILLRIWI
ncbi:MAG: hypothetical protein CVU11_02315 [Bacteroidetes bacterium HGW-Bacteroidetes-6]|nr:MAG: hypothetical protein CVU11_02315 [Bacteroidetes bacterium HGW-Bacteroidetes-6]